MAFSLEGAVTVSSDELGARVPRLGRTASAIGWGFHTNGGDRFRLWSSIREKRAVVSGATLKSRNKK
jgi:hypothetical protein